MFSPGHQISAADGCHHRRQQQQQVTVCSREKLTRRPLLELIADAILQSTDKRLLVNDIYQYIEAQSEIGLFDSRDVIKGSSVDECNYGSAGLTFSTDDRDSSLTIKTDKSTVVRVVKEAVRVVKEATWKVHVRHILSVRKTIFPLTNDKDGQRRGRFHTIDESKFHEYRASLIGRRSMPPSGGRRRRSHLGRPVVSESGKKYEPRGSSEIGEVGGLLPQSGDSYGLIGDTKYKHFSSSVNDRFLCLREPLGYPQHTTDYTMTSWKRCSEQLQLAQHKLPNNTHLPTSSRWQSPWQRSQLYQCHHFQAGDNLDHHLHHNCYHQHHLHMQQQQQGSCSSIYRDGNTHPSTTYQSRMSQLTTCGLLPTAVNINGWLERDEQQFEFESRDYQQLQSSEYEMLNCHLFTAEGGVLDQWNNEKYDLGGCKKSVLMSGDWRPSSSRYNESFISVRGHSDVDEYHLQHHHRADERSTSTMTSYPVFCPSTAGDVGVRLQPMETGSCLTEHKNDETSGDVGESSLTSEPIAVAQHRAWKLGASPSNNICRPIMAEVVQLLSPERFSTSAYYIEDNCKSDDFGNSSIFGGIDAGTLDDHELSGMSTVWPECGQWWTQSMARVWTHSTISGCQR